MTAMGWQPIAATTSSIERDRQPDVPIGGLNASLER